MDRRHFLHRLGHTLAGTTIAAQSAKHVFSEPPSARPSGTGLEDLAVEADPSETIEQAPTRTQTATQTHEIHVARDTQRRPDLWYADELTIRPATSKEVTWDLSAPFNDPIGQNEDEIIAENGLRAWFLFWSDLAVGSGTRVRPFGAVRFERKATKDQTSVSLRFVGPLSKYMKQRGKPFSLEYVLFFPDIDRLVVGRSSPPKIILNP